MAKLTQNWLALFGALVLGTAAPVFAQDSGPLIDALVRKGILNDQEAEDLRADLLKDVATTSSGKLDFSAPVTRLRITGDARVRYQFDNEPGNVRTAGDADRHRFRYRFRLGFTADLGSKWSTGIRFESASGATSTNADFGTATSGVNDNFGKSNDLAYIGQVFIAYKDQHVLAADEFDARIGKFAHKFFNPGVNGFWIDSDINFEGAAQELVYRDLIAKGWNLSFRAGQFILSNPAAQTSQATTTFTTTGIEAVTNRLTGTRNTTVVQDNEPSMLFMFQAEAASKTWKVAPTFVLYGAPSYHDHVTTGVARTNDTAVYTDLATILVPVEYTTTFNAQPFAVFGTVGYNLQGQDRAERLAISPPAIKTGQDDNYIANAGVRYGNNRLPGDYQLTAEYRYVGSGSYSSILLDSDFNGGFLNGQGTILSASYNFTDAVSSTVTYFNSFNIEGNRTSGGGTNRGNGPGTAQVLQVDLSARF